MQTKRYDKRTVDRYVEKGVFKKTEVESYLKALPDEEANASWVEIDLDSAESMDEEVLQEGLDGEAEDSH